MQAYSKNREVLLTLNKNRMAKHEKIMDAKKWNPLIIKKMALIKTICKCGHAHEVSEHKPLELCQLCRMKDDPEFAMRAQEGGFSVGEFLKTSEELKKEMKREDPVGLQKMIERAEKRTEPIKVPAVKRKKSSVKTEEKISLILGALGSKGEWVQKKTLANQLTGKDYGLNSGTYERALGFLAERGHISIKKDERGPRFGRYIKNNGTFIPGTELPKSKRYGKASDSPKSAPADEGADDEPENATDDRRALQEEDVEDQAPFTHDQDQPGKLHEVEGGHQDGKFRFGHAKSIEIQVKDVKIIIQF